MTEYIVIGAVLVCIFLYYIIKKSIETSREKKLKAVVAWCVTDNSNTFRCNLHLWEYISNAQIKLKLLQEYRISTEEEWDLVKEIIKGLQKDITQKYLNNQISIPTSKYVIPDETYFMYLLQEYCEKHQCDYTFLGYDMHKETVSYQSYGSWGGQLYDATYGLTDFAVVLHKLYYISYMHCKNSTPLNPNGKYWTNERSIENIIDSRKLSVSRM